MHVPLFGILICLVEMQLRKNQPDPTYRKGWTLAFYHMKEQEGERENICDSECEVFDNSYDMSEFAFFILVRKTLRSTVLIELVTLQSPHFQGLCNQLFFCHSDVFD